MALAGRSARRGGAGLRWLAAGVVITLFVLLIDASLHSASPDPARQVQTGAWVDAVLPLVTASNAQGQELASVWTDGLSRPPAADAALVASVARSSAATYAAAARLVPPSGLAGPAGLLDAALLSREKAAATVSTAFLQALGPAAAGPGTAGSGAAPSTLRPGAGSPTTTTPAPSPVSAAQPAALVAQSLPAAATDLQLGDEAYQLFLSSLPSSVGVRFPPSAWAGDLAPYAPQAATVFLASLQSAAVTTPVYRASVVSVATNPSPVATAPDGTQTLPDATAMTVTIVVADTGNQPLDRLMVTASLTPGRAGGASSARDFVNLAVGQAYTIQGLGPLDPPLGTNVTLQVTAGGDPGSPVPAATTTIVFTMPAPAAAPSTTRPAAG
jgi:hypothetical protein